MAIALTYVGRGLYLAECTYCPWTHTSDSMHEAWVDWKLHDKRTHA